MLDGASPVLYTFNAGCKRSIFSKWRTVLQEAPSKAESVLLWKRANYLWRKPDGFPFACIGSIAISNSEESVDTFHVLSLQFNPCPYI